MKKTTKKHNLSRGVLLRVLMAVLVLGMLGGMLTSCGSGGSTKITTIAYTQPDLVEGSSMTLPQIEEVAKQITSKKNEALLIREKLVAAQNGYDITGTPGTAGSKYDASKTEDGRYDVTLLPPAEPAKSVEFAEKVLAEYSIVYASDVKLNEAALATLINGFKITVDTDAKLGALDQLLHWIGLGFEWLINVPGFGSFILGTVYFAVIIEILMLPLGIRQQNNSRKQARLRPREMAIRNKYKGRNDQATMQKLNREIQDLYQKEGYSPTAGCLPLLITLPFMMFLYYIVIDPLVYMMGASEGLAGAFLTYASAHPAAGGLGLSMNSTRGTIEVLSLIRENGLSLDSLADFGFFTNGEACLSALDGMVDRIPDFSILGMNMGETPQFLGGNLWLMLIPILTFVVYWGSGKITRKFTFQPMQAAEGDPAQGCSNTMMNVMMPAMSAFFTFMVPAAVGLYWMFKSIIGTLKQFILFKLMPLPTFTEEEYKAAERELSGKDKNKPVKKSGTRNPNIRSLHHIDDEDYETPAPVDPKKSAVKPDYVEEDDKPAADVADNAYSTGVSLKEDTPREAKPFRQKKKNQKAAADTDGTSDSDSDATTEN